MRLQRNRAQKNRIQESLKLPGCGVLRKNILIDYSIVLDFGGTTALAVGLCKDFILA